MTMLLPYEDLTIIFTIICNEHNINYYSLVTKESQRTTNDWRTIGKIPTVNNLVVKIVELLNTSRSRNIDGHLANGIL